MCQALCWFVRRREGGLAGCLEDIPPGELLWNTVLFGGKRVSIGGTQKVPGWSPEGMKVALCSWLPGLLSSSKQRPHLS